VGVRSRITGVALLAAVGTAVLLHMPDSASSREPIALRGAGATLPAPLYERWIRVYRDERPDVLITYDVVGSGEGQRRFLADTVDFGASDAALSDEQIAKVSVGVQLVPVTAGMVVLAYNLPQVGGPLRIPRDVCVDIFAGRVRSWNDPRLRAANPGLDLPAQSIAIVARQDGSGTTFAFTNHLSAISAVWRDRGPGVGTLVDWKTAMLARGNEGVAGRIKVSEGSIGYVEYHFAKRLGLPMAELQNKAGRYVAPTERSGQAALANSAAAMPENLRLFVPDPDGDDSYPIVTYSWLLVRRKNVDGDRTRALKEFVKWGLTTGQKWSSELGYVPLPREVAALSVAALDRIN
jgi:phosphate transport system substrate-binding protein